MIERMIATVPFVFCDPKFEAVQIRDLYHADSSFFEQRPDLLQMFERIDEMLQNMPECDDIKAILCSRQVIERCHVSLQIELFTRICDGAVRNIDALNIESIVASNYQKISPSATDVKQTAGWFYSCNTCRPLGVNSMEFCEKWVVGIGSILPAIGFR
jgi:hypothetical protein